MKEINKSLKDLHYVYFLRSMRKLKDNRIFMSKSYIVYKEYRIYTFMTIRNKILWTGYYNDLYELYNILRFIQDKPFGNNKKPFLFLYEISDYHKYTNVILGEKDYYKFDYLKRISLKYDKIDFNF